MKLKQFFCAILVIGLGTFTPPGFPAFDPVNDDTDIFLANPTFNVNRPNVLIILDNTANWNTPFVALKSALVSAVNGLNDSFNVGLMMFTETGTGNSNPDGGYVKFAIRQMTPGNTGNKKVLTDMVTGLDINADKSNGGKGSLSMYEAFQYFGGATAYAGANKAKRDYGGNSANAAGSIAGNALANATATTYLSPITDGCQKNFIIYISNGPAQDNASDLTVSENKLKSLNGGTTPSVITLSPNGSQDNWADEWAKYMSTADCNTTIAGVQNVITYTLDVGPAGASSGQGPGWTALLKSMATQGKGKYFPINNNDAGTASAIASALNTIFTEVQAVNSVFASTTLPVSVNVRGTNLNQVYIGVFRPDANKAPRWLGNLKMYKLAAANSVVFLADANNVKAENSDTGFITNTATSFWTAESCFWSYLGADPNGNAPAVGDTPCTVPTAYTYWSDKPDGDKVEKGGAAQRLRTNFLSSQATRKVYTCTSAAANGICASGATLSATPFSAGGTGYPADNTHITALDMLAYTTYSISDLTNSGSMVTAQLAAPYPSPYFAVGESVRIEGASPVDFNGDYSITAIDATAGTFQYVFGASFGGRTAIVTAANHKLNNGDRVLPTASSGAPSEYNQTNHCDATTPYTITLLSTSQFTYRLCNSAATSATTIPTLVAYKSGTALSGAGTAATLSLPGHGFTGTTVALSIDTNGGNTSFNAGSPTTEITANIVNTDTLTYTTPTTISGAATTAKVTLTAHSLKVGDMLTITGASEGYNCAGTCPVVSVIDANTFTYTPLAAISAAATGTISISATRSFITTLTLANGSGGSRNLVTATAPAGTTLDVSTTAWTATVAGASNTNFNVSLATITDASSTTIAKFNVASPGPTASTTLTPASSGTVTFTRNALTPGAGAMAPVVSYTGTINVKKTLTGITSVSVRNNATGVMTAGKTSTGDATLRAKIMNWVLGRDNAEGEAPPGSTPAAVSDTDIRPSVHGDVLHSRPAVVNYNRFSAHPDDDIYIFYGGNDGMLRAVKGGAASDEVGVNPGDERWSFIPREFFSKFKRLRNNSPAISSAVPRDYLGDGPISVYVSDAVKADNTAGSDGKISAGVTGPGGEVDKVHIFYGFRRGGRFIYAMDVTDPATPKFLWRKTSADAGFSELGFTWSEPKVAKLRILNTSTSAIESKPVLIFGGGYDPQIDDVNPCLLSASNTGLPVGADSGSKITLKAVGSGTVTYTAAGSCTITGATGGTTDRTRSMGRAIFVLDAATGAIIWHAGSTATTGGAWVSGTTQGRNVAAMTCAIPSDIAVIDIDREGHADRGYVGDTCGKMWRINLTDTSPANWQVLQVADVSSTTTTDIANKRRFLFPPDVVLSSDSTGDYAAVLIGSGDREHPFSTDTTDRFYMFKDRTTGTVFNTDASCNAAAVATSPIEEAKLTNSTDQVANKNDKCGFQITFAVGEKNVGSAVTIAGSTFFNTNQPSSSAGGGACSSNLGIARQYVIGFEDASATIDQSGSGGVTLSDRSATYGQGGFLPSPVPAIVDIDGKRYQVVISGTSVRTPEAASLDSRSRTYWYKDFD